MRDKDYQWKATLPGNTSKTLWSAFHPIADLPQVLNPACGYLFNSNHSPFNATAKEDNIQAKDYNPTMGYETHDNNRSHRFMELMQQYPKLNYENFKRIKYDIQLPASLAYQTQADTLFLLNPKDYPEIASQINTLTQWDRKATIDSKGAALFGIIYYKVVEEQTKGATYRVLTKSKCVELLTYSSEYLRKHFGKTEVTLGEYQKLVRGDKQIPLRGLPDVISAMHAVTLKDGRMKGDQGESYIELVKFTPQGPEIETVNCYGASNNPDSEHFSDQMDLFIQQKTKPMTLDKVKVYKEAKKVYHPQ